MFLPTNIWYAFNYFASNYQETRLRMIASMQKRENTSTINKSIPI